MRMLLLICGKTRKDGITNDTVQDMIGMKKIEEILRADIAMVCGKNREGKSFNESKNLCS